MSRFTELFDIFTWNATLSLVSLVMLANCLVLMIAARSFAPGGLLFIVWIVIPYHIISVSYKKYRKKTQQEASYV